MMMKTREEILTDLLRRALEILELRLDPLNFVGGSNDYVEAVDAKNDLVDDIRRSVGELEEEEDTKLACLNCAGKPEPSKNKRKSRALSLG